MRGREVLLISCGGRWQLPKGRLEPGEAAAAAALREVEEETGVRGSMRTSLPTIDYWFARSGTRIHKRVDYFLVDYRSGSTDDYDAAEVDAAAWFEWQEAVERLTFANERHVVEAARRIADGTPEEPAGERGGDG